MTVHTLFDNANVTIQKANWMQMQLFKAANRMQILQK